VQACAFAEAEQCAHTGRAATTRKLLLAWKEEYGVDVAAPEEPPVLQRKRRKEETE
jgi:hypothetical protein